jgi:isopentenyl-diphosphate Delta-isomerase
MPELSLAEVDLRTAIAGVPLAEPVLIGAMTGGAPQTEAINRALAEVAGALGLAMAVGSQTAGLRDPGVRSSYTVVRQENPHGVVLANVGAGAGVGAALQAVEMLQADLLQVHLNAPQELVMREGDRDFRGHLAMIRDLVRRSPVPVVVKECGFGLSRQTAGLLYEAGVRAVDVAGRGGTNFAWIEAERREGEAVDSGLVDWGIPTACSLLEVLSHSKPDLTVIAGGGIDRGTAAAKALAIGAAAVSVAGPVLRAMHAEGVEGARRYLTDFIADMKAAALLCGAGSLAALQRAPAVVTGFTEFWCRQRGIETAHLARRDLAGPAQPQG